MSGLLGSGSVHLQGRYKGKGLATSASAGKASAQCQKCLQHGHWTYECKNAPIYHSRPSRTQQLLNPKAKQALADPSDQPPEIREAAARKAAELEVKARLTQKTQKKQKKRRRESSSGSDSDSDSDSSSSSSSSDDSSGSSSGGSSSSSSDDSSGSSSSDTDSGSSSSDDSSSSSDGSSGSGNDSSEDEAQPRQKRAKPGRHLHKSMPAKPASRAAPLDQPDLGRERGAPSERDRGKNGHRHDWNREPRAESRQHHEPDRRGQDRPDGRSQGEYQTRDQRRPEREGFRRRDTHQSAGHDRGSDRWEMQ
ncbi:hypothetical protein WJX84_006966 [Apatococcus fuscideae]|uniref:Zinc knuckle-domain-containing protein n=1 Tax=Apatococcus fuscideae TaxID=2026836 RepID=A0AAW1T828_9CHLO